MSRRTVLFPEDDVFIPNCINRDAMKTLFTGCSSQVKENGMNLVKENNWRFYCVDQSRGRCYLREQVITIPVFAMKRDHGFKEWYISHEMAHAYAWMIHKHWEHGPEFMRELIRICPNEFIHYELGYKPRNAASAGITSKGVIDTSALGF